MPIARQADVSIDSCNACVPTTHTRLLRYAATLVVLCLLALPRAHAESAPTLLRAALIVKDATRSIDFYSQLGFRIDSDTTSARNPRDNPFPLNAPATQTRLVIMTSANGEGGASASSNSASPRRRKYAVTRPKWAAVTSCWCSTSPMPTPSTHVCVRRTPRSSSLLRSTSRDARPTTAGRCAAKCSTSRTPMVIWSNCCKRPHRKEIHP